MYRSADESDSERMTLRGLVGLGSSKSAQLVYEKYRWRRIQSGLDLRGRPLGRVDLGFGG